MMYKPHLTTQFTFPDEGLHVLFDDAPSYLELSYTNGDYYNGIVNVRDQCSTKSPVL